MAIFSKHQDGTHFIHGHKMTDLAERLSFTQAIFYTWTGRMPDEKQEAMLNACLVALIDHGEEALSAKAARIAASGGAETHAAVAAGMLAAGTHHGATVLRLATELFREAVENKRTAKNMVAEALVKGARLPGYGHRVYETDPRTTLLLAKAEKLGFADEHVRLALEIEQELERQKGKKLCLNVDGAIAALLPALGIASDLAPGLFLVARAVGLTAHVAEERGEKPASQRKT